jgi:hypothetical protein
LEALLKDTTLRDKKTGNIIKEYNIQGLKYCPFSRKNKNAYTLTEA